MTFSASQFTLSGKRALITGSSAGIGHALAVGLAGAGAGIVLNGRNQLRLDEATLALADAGVAVSSLLFDVTNPPDVARAIDRFEDETGPIDILVNATGMNLGQPLEATPAPQFEEMRNTLGDAAACTGEAVARHMARRGGGRIVTLCAPDWDPPGTSPSAEAAANVALIARTKTMAAHFAPAGITVNGLGMGRFAPPTADPLAIEAAPESVPMGRALSQDDLIAPLVFLASPACNFVTGQILWVDGGLSVAR